METTLKVKKKYVKEDTGDLGDGIGFLVRPGNYAAKGIVEEQSNTVVKYIGGIKKTETIKEENNAMNTNYLKPLTKVKIHPVKVKRCSVCKKPEGEVEFGNNNANKDGKQYKCKDCTKKYQNERYGAMTKVAAVEIPKVDTPEPAKLRMDEIDVIDYTAPELNMLTEDKILPEIINPAYELTILKTEYSVVIEYGESANFSLRWANVNFRSEEDGKWHHHETNFHCHNRRNPYNLGDFVFLGKLADKIIEIKKDLNK